MEIENQSFLKNIVKRKESKELYYTMRSLLGIQWWTWAWIIGARGRGKSYAAVDTVLSYMKRYGEENVKCYYFRISDLSIKKMLENKGAKAIDNLLVRKYNLNLSTKGSCLCNNGNPIIQFYPLVSAAKIGKGIAEYDPDFLNSPDNKRNRFIFCIVDEFMMAEGIEKKSIGSPVEQFKIYLENILRDQERLDYPAVRVIGCANAVSDCSDFLAQLAGFIPEAPGRYKLKRKHTIVDNIPNSNRYIEARKKSYQADIMDYENDSNYTNILKRDLKTLKPKSQKLHKISWVIKFSKNPKDWYIVWDNKVVKQYGKQTFSKSKVIAMRRHLDEEYSKEMADEIFARYDAKYFMYNDLISQATFAQHMKNLKAK